MNIQQLNLKDDNVIYMNICLLDDTCQINNMHFSMPGWNKSFESKNLLWKLQQISIIVRAHNGQWQKVPNIGDSLQSDNYKMGNKRTP